jgi:CHASE3 domain sensor protein
MFIYMYLLAVLAVVTFLVQVQSLNHSRCKATETDDSEEIDIIQLLSPAVGIA